jgi:hypothetical protein
MHVLYEAMHMIRFWAQLERHEDRDDSKFQTTY